MGAVGLRNHPQRGLPRFALGVGEGAGIRHREADEAIADRRARWQAPCDGTLPLRSDARSDTRIMVAPDWPGELAPPSDVPPESRDATELGPDSVALDPPCPGA
jgi:hypothetical protein